MQDAKRLVKKDQEVGKEKERREVGIIVIVFFRDYFKIWIKGRLWPVLRVFVGIQLKCRHLLSCWNLNVISPFIIWLSQKRARNY